MATGFNNTPPASEFRRPTSWGRTRGPKNLGGGTGATASATAPTAAPTAATDGFATENQRFLHVLLDGVTDTSNLGLVVWAYSHAFGSWGKLTDVNNVACTIANGASPQIYRVFEISGVDRVYLQSTSDGGDAPPAGGDKVFIACSTF